MTVLIVDDQPSVVSGIFSGINWSKLGVGLVLKAYNTMEAKLQFFSHPIDIMLCDIEMPGENGLSLLVWVREHGYPAKCIFLTAHAEFLYAKQALVLGGFDYIVQPARYEDIENALKKAIDACRAEQEQQEYYSFGKALYQNKDIVLSGVLRNFLMGEKINAEDVARMALQGELSFGLKDVAPVLLHIVRQTGKPWEKSTVEAALENILTELYTPMLKNIFITALSADRYVFLLPVDKNVQHVPAELAVPLERLVEIGQSHFGWGIACYVASPGNLEHAPRSTALAKEFAENNVIQASGIFHINDYNYLEGNADSSNIPSMTKNHWIELLGGGQAKQMEREALLALEQMAQKKALNAESLQRFYQDFSQVAYQAARELGIEASTLYQDKDNLKAALESYSTIEKMKAYIQQITGFFQDYSGNAATSAKEQVESIVAYIYANIDQNIRRTDIAESVYLNPDYVSRMFKKETGKSLKEYIIEQKMTVAKKLLHTTDLPVSIIALRVGYSNFSHFSQTYKRIMGLTPNEERHKSGEN